ncbi:MAG: class I SAM-dependent methyltransferase [Fibrobacteres bacterium]|nr:class I SAM-dependent methyltransferase [Fibrobacterota bacterium]
MKRPFVGPSVAFYAYELIRPYLIREYMNVLEVGCGLGAFLFRYAKNNSKAKITGIDISTELIDFLNTYYKDDADKLSFTNTDFSNTNLSIAAEYDLVYSSDVIEHLTNPAGFVKNTYKALLPNGRLIVNFPNIESHGIFHFNTVDEIKEMFKEFNKVEIISCEYKDEWKGYFALRRMYDSFKKGEFENIRAKVYESEKQGLDYFSESSSFAFSKKTHGKKLQLMLLLESLFLLWKPSVSFVKNNEGTILNKQRILIIADK